MKNVVKMKMYCVSYFTTYLRDRFQWNLHQNSYILFQEIAFEIVVREITAMFSRPQRVNSNQNTNYIISNDQCYS